MLDEKYVFWYAEIFRLYKGILHGEVNDIKGQNLDDWQQKADKFIGVMAEIIRKII
jgi:hypothetical protein